MSKLEQICHPSASAEARWHKVGANPILPSQRRSSVPGGISLLPVDAERKVICFPSYSAASRQKSDLRREVRTGESNVIRFRSRSLARPESGPQRWDTTRKSPTEDIENSKYTPEIDDDHRHRILVNALAAGVLIALMIAGEWVVSTLAQIT
jgi:hypothetical protein